jgi:hypothetical protein
MSNKVTELETPNSQYVTKQSTSKKLIFIIFVGCLISIIIFFRLCCGFFVIQPIGAIPNGVTIVYWRAGLNMPFITSADGLLNDSDNKVSILGRGLILANLSEPILKRKIFRFGYSETLYLWSTGGKKYAK